MWTIERVRPRIEWRQRRPKLVRYEFSWANTAYGAFRGVATTRKQAERGLLLGQAEMFAEDYR